MTMILSTKDEVEVLIGAHTGQRFPVVKYDESKVGTWVWVDIDGVSMVYDITEVRLVA